MHDLPRYRQTFLKFPSMDILLTLVASVLLIIGFFVICRTVDDEEDDQEESGDKAEPSEP